MHRISNTQNSFRVPVLLDSDVPKRDQFRLAEPLVVELFDGRLVTIPAGFVSDAHSTPAWLDNILPHFDAKTNLAAIVHDYLYMHWEAFVWEQIRTVEGCRSMAQLLAKENDRQYADEAYHYLMEQMAPGRWRNAVYWLAVRLLGGWNWRRFRHKDCLSRPGKIVD